MNHTDNPSDRLGATVLHDGQTHFRVWAPSRETVTVEIVDEQPARTYPLVLGDGGYFTGVAPVAAGERYSYRLDHQHRRPDPASRFQPEGVHGPSQVINPATFQWTDHAWRGVAKRDLVIYELHVGAFTELGTFRAAIERLPELVELGVTAIELMPVSQTPGAFNWGYDGVNLYAANHTYGHPDDLRALVDACHARGLAVLLDVVYNHLGPEGNYLNDFGPYASRRHHTPWGDALNFDGRRRLPVRRFVVENALYWLEEFHLDGLRLDAAHFMHDDSDRHILAEIRDAVSSFQESAGREVHLIAEANVYDHELLSSDGERPPYDAIWCDCLMHALYSLGAPEVKLTGRQYAGAGDIAEALGHGYLYFDADHQRANAKHRDSFHPERNRSHLASLVMALQTHDSVGNHPHGWRLHQLASKEFQRAAAALLLLYPSIPLIFMGEETASDAPFPFFADFGDKRLRRAVNKGRAREYPSEQHQRAPRPTSQATFAEAKLHRTEQQDPTMRAWYQRLLALRHAGLREGWLDPAGLTTTWARENGVFTLEYAHPDGGAVAVHARLASDGSTLRFSPPGGVLACSLGRHEGASAPITLNANHAVITRSQ